MDFQHDVAQQRFELDTGGGAAFVSYQRTGDTLALTHTEVPPRMRGRGVGARLVGEVLAAARADGLRVRPLCSFVRAYIARHPEVQDLVA